MKKTIIKNIKIICENEILTGHNVLIENGKIAGILKNKIAGNECKVIDGHGNYLSPGFIDIHNHGNSGFDVMDGNLKALKSIAEFHAKNGVTSFLGSTITASPTNTVKAIKNGVEYYNNSKNRFDKAKFLGLYLEGPFFSLKKKGAQPGEFIRDPNIDQLKEYIQAGNGLVKIVALAPELNGAIEAVQHLRNNNITVSAGHSNATYAETMTGIHNGITEATHVYNGMPGLHHREPGILGAVLLDNRVSCEMICDGIHLHNAAMQLVCRTKGKEKVILISDAMRATGLDNGEYDLGGQKVTVKGYEARLADGVLAGSTLTLNRAVKNMVEHVGVPLVDAVLMATLNPAKQIGIDHKLGSIAVGKNADLVIFDKDIKILQVFINGNILRK